MFGFESNCLFIGQFFTSKNCKKAEHDGVEESEAHGQGVFMDDCGDDEDGKHGSCAESPLRQLQGSQTEHRDRTGVKGQQSRLVPQGFFKSYSHYVT